MEHSILRMFDKKTTSRDTSVNVNLLQQCVPEQKARIQNNKISLPVIESHFALTPN